MGSDLQFSVGADPTEFNSGMKTAADSAARFSGQIAEKVGGKLYGLRDVSNVVSSALGLNLKDIADKVARFITGISKEEEAAFNNAAALSDQATAASIKNMRAMLSEEQRYQLALAERDKLIIRLSEVTGASGKAQEKAAQTRLDLENKISEIQAFELKQSEARQAKFEEEIKSRAELRAKIIGAGNEALAIDQRIAALKDQIAVKEQAINDHLFVGKDLEREKNLLSTRRVELANAESEATKAAAAASRKSYDERASATEAYAKMLFDQKSTEEQIQVLQKARRGIITEMAAVGKDSTLYMQDAVELGRLDNEIRTKTLGVERQITPELRAQTDEITAQVEARKKQQAIQKDINILEGFMVSVKGGADWSSMSSAALQGQINKLKSQLTEIGVHGQQIGNSDQNRETGDWLTASNIRGQLNPAQRELALRSEVVTYDRRYGDAATTAKYGDDLTQRSLADFTQSFNDSAKKTNTVLETISQQLNQLGL